MRIGLIVNVASALGGAQTTLELAARLLAREHAVILFDVASLGFQEDLGWTALGLELRVPLSNEALGTAAQSERHDWLPLTELDAVLIRTSPGRDPRLALHQQALGVLAMLEAEGVPVLSSPLGLLKASSKAYLGRLPAEHRPEMTLAATAPPLKAFMGHRDRGVFKPVSGTRGSDVFLLDQRAGSDPNMSALADTVTRGQYALAQEYLPEAPLGDVRALVLDGQLLSVGGVAACVRRVPGSGEFRSNVHCGGHARPATPTPAMERAIDSIGPLLAADGIFLAGLDFVGDRVVEVNVFAPGGLGDAGRFHSRDFYAPVIDAVERRAAGGVV